MPLPLLHFVSESVFFHELLTVLCPYHYCILSVKVGLMRLHCTDEAQQGRNSVASVASYSVLETICWMQPSEHCLQLSSYVWVELCTLCTVCEQIQWSCTVLPEWWWDKVSSGGTLVLQVYCYLVTCGCNNMYTIVLHVVIIRMYRPLE